MESFFQDVINVISADDKKIAQSIDINLEVEEIVNELIKTGILNFSTD